MSTVTIYYPISFESNEVLSEVKKYGNVFTSPANMDTREIHTDLPRTDLDKLEAFFVENEVPYDLMEYSKGANAPKMKKVRPEQEFEKEINCVFYQGEEIEEGVVAVSTLLSIIEQADKDTLAESLLEEIKKATFKFDNLEDIFEM
ncbi:hypothetical protein CVD28_01890 [Bacillus sp. M6-12]|uniref:hypothetical protein n=1 Tax=Bacillus sp. M6-12 TaxID=2054166 RepID=UPI000C7781EA|nr:hypothetical protein [Bacillus sp. M6-12]PLS19183.1 hypothetical protein CVD28_01890 [Bacillus sp. M6-12]